MDEDGEFDLGLCVHGTATLYLDGELVTTASPKSAIRN